MSAPDIASSALTGRLAERLRDRIIAGELLPGQRLSENALAAELSVSRNTLREAFRLLTKDGLLRHEPHRGVFVTAPDHAAVIDIYRVRRLVEGRALAAAEPGHPAIARMRAAVERAEAARESVDWQGVGSANMAFHAAIVDLADSARLAAFYAQVAAELRLAFGLLATPEALHAPFIDGNRTILEALEAGRPADAADLLDAYLGRAERIILGALSRRTAPSPAG
ncbi:GntR family transcriptional regulator [Aureimonas sp. Leaf324]|jgi:DNA-binding GntR family transcriptional regulator|uniref:GntR family transcriptional regulator n=1 Tax=Aureimonas sp. Leaf324 TaxID=1736336 RepID=UPI0006FC483F|nr:GntR family transcriptional regulator [Aureimonas sp. Leaf324]KQQ90310.1 GntR family transcriptional regulator [Aureimonas sp. Leaf324]